MADSTTTRRPAPAGWHFIGEEDRFCEGREFLGTWLMFLDENEDLRYVKKETNSAQ